MQILYQQKSVKDLFVKDAMSQKSRTHILIMCVRNNLSSYLPTLLLVTAPQYWDQATNQNDKNNPYITEHLQYFYHIFLC